MSLHWGGRGPGHKSRWPKAANPNARALSRFWSALAARNTTPVDIMTVGDSISEGYPPSGVAANLLTDQAWRKLLIDKLRTQYPTSGAPGTPGYYAANRQTVAPADYPVVNTGGSAANYCGLGLRNVHLNSASDNLVFTVPAGTTAVDVFWDRFSGTTTFNWSVNGGSTTNVNTAGTPELDMRATRISGLTGGDTVKLDYVSGAGVFIDGFYAYGGDETKGLRIWDSARTSVSCNTLIAVGTQRWFTGFNVIQPALVLIELGPNDSPTRTAAQLKADLLTLISLIKAQCTITPSFMLLATWRVGDPLESWTNYVTGMREISAADADVGFYDMRGAIPKSDANMDTVGGLLPDSTHPGVAGSVAVANGVFPAIIP